MADHASPQQTEEEYVAAQKDVEQRKVVQNMIADIDAAAEGNAEIYTQWCIERFGRPDSRGMWKARAEKAEAENKKLRDDAEFVARWAWRTDPPGSSSTLSDSERLSAIKYYPPIKDLAKPHIELAESETRAISKEPTDG